VITYQTTMEALGNFRCECHAAVQEAVRSFLTNLSSSPVDLIVDLTGNAASDVYDERTLMSAVEACTKSNAEAESFLTARQGSRGNAVRHLWACLPKLVGEYGKHEVASKVLELLIQQPAVYYRSLLCTIAKQLGNKGIDYTFHRVTCLTHAAGRRKRHPLQKKFPTRKEIKEMQEQDDERLEMDDAMDKMEAIREKLNSINEISHEGDDENHGFEDNEDDYGEAYLEKHGLEDGNQPSYDETHDEDENGESPRL